MKNLLLSLLLVFSTNVAYSAEQKKVCITDEKTKKQTCKVMKMHKKLEGTKVPEKKK